MNKDNQTRIDMYLRGEMSAEERKTFEHDLTVDASLQKDYDLTRLIVKGLKQRVLMEKMKKWDAEGKIKAKKWKWGVGIGAAAACVCAIMVFSNRSADYNMQSNMACEDQSSHKYSEFIEAESEKTDKDMALACCASNDAVAKEQAIAPDSDVIVLTRNIDNDNTAAAYQEDAVGFSSIEEKSDSVMYEFLWRRINVLLDSETYPQLLEILEDYRNIDGPHKEEAEEIWKKLTAD